MTFAHTIMIEADEAAVRAKAGRVFASFGFAPEGGGGLRFHRGSTAGSFVSLLSPERWAAVAHIELAQTARGTVAALRIDVNSRGQIITTASERGFWEAQAAEIAQGMTSEIVASRPSARLKKRARNENIAALALIACLTFLFAALAWIRWHSVHAYAGGALTGLSAGTAFLLAWLKLRMG